jgi:hypothetical protein
MDFFLYLIPTHSLVSPLQSEAGIPPTHDSNHMSELSIEYSSALEREKELNRRYEDLFGFLRSHIKDSQVSGRKGERGGEKARRGEGKRQRGEGEGRMERG